MEEFFNELFDYNFFSNKQLIEACRNLEEVPKESIRLFSHILNAHQIWNARIIGAQPDFGVWDEHPLESWEDIHYENQRNTFEIITNSDDYEARIDYQNSEGRLFTNTIQDMLFHIINHSTHHRAQILANFRAKGLEPVSLDYVFYKR
ncbi:DinB family protein [Muriicola soli]|uniref:Damage-inducible protein DinB n=1 Tax=Muriicola soli TaxID=2507538 RepID=A0A411ED78_9FLAO|nr:DinB family protein [Muriicola soli]QBA65520.1 damage-inducible protein DinB [Muriicola soli]